MENNKKISNIYLSLPDLSNYDFDYLIKIKKEDTKATAQINLFYNDKKCSVNNIWQNQNLLYKNQIYLYPELLFWKKELYYSNLTSDFSRTTYIISPYLWSIFQYYYLNIKDDNEFELKNEKILTFTPYLEELNYKDTYKNYKNELKKSKYKFYLKIDLKNFYDSINIDSFLLFLNEKYNYFKKDDNFQKIYEITTLIKILKKDSRFPIIEVCPLINFLLNNLFLRRILSDFLYSNNEYDIQIVHYCDDIYIFYDELEVNLFVNKLNSYFNQNNVSINFNKYKSGKSKDLNDEIIMYFSPYSDEYEELDEEYKKNLDINQFEDYLFNICKNFEKNEKNEFIIFSNLESDFTFKLFDFYFCNIISINKCDYQNCLKDVKYEYLIKIINLKPVSILRLIDKFYKNDQYLNKYHPFAKLFYENSEELSETSKIYYSVLRTNLKYKRTLNDIEKIKHENFFIKTNYNCMRLMNLWIQVYYFYQKDDNLYINSVCSFLECICDENLKKITLNKDKQNEKYSYYFYLENHILEKNEANYLDKLRKFRNKSTINHSEAKKIEKFELIYEYINNILNKIMNKLIFKL